MARRAAGPAGDGGCHVLIVDDEDDFRESLGVLLEAHGCRVTEAGTGEQALELLGSGLEPDIILLDLRMPGLTGTEALARMRQRGVRIPALLVSAARDVESVAEEHGFEGAILKPFSPDDLMKCIRRFARRPARGGDGVVPRSGPDAGGNDRDGERR